MIFNINFFLFCFAQSNIFSYTCVYAKYYANVTNVRFGTLAMILPTLALIAKPIACSLTDAHGIHKQFLICALAVFGLSYGSLGIIPFFKDPQDHDTDFIAWIIISILLAIGYVACACIFCMNDALASNYARKHNKSYGRMRIFANSGWASGALLIMVIGEISWLPFRVPGCMILVLFIVADIVVLTLWPYQEDFEMFHDGSTVEQRKLSMVGPNTMALMAQSRPRTSISRDMLERIKTGRSKSVGGSPKVNMFSVYSVNQQTDSLAKFKQEKPQPTKSKKEYTNFQCQMILLKMIIMKHKSFIRYIALFTIFGLVQGVMFNFQFDYLKAKVVKDDAEFEFISTLCMISQSIFGEILINLIAGEMLKIFGANANMSLALVTLGLRCFFYGNVLPYVNSKYIIIPEALQGPSLGLYWVLTVDIGSNYALMVTDFMPEMKRRGIIRDRVHEEELNGCLRATMIGVMSSSMEGLGVALGALFGGLISNSSLGYEGMWNFCALLSITTGFINISWDILMKLVLKNYFKKPIEKQANSNQIPTLVIEKIKDSKL